MKILVTGAKGFVGKNLIAELKNRKYDNIFECDIETSQEELEVYTKECDFVYHLAGVNRPKTEEEFMQGNFGFTSDLLELLKKQNNKAPILISSSIQAERDNSYGLSKKAGENLIFSYGEENNIKTYVYRLPNVFGKWSRPNYNTVVATYCYNIARDLEIQINNSEAKLNLVYIDDVIEEFINAMEGKGSKRDKFYQVKTNYNISLGELAKLIKSFKEGRKSLSIANMSNPLEKKMYSTYLSFLPKENFSYPLKMNIDERGSFTEFIRTKNKGQVSINVSKPGIIKGNHWHHTKNEKFLVVSGEGLIRFRKIDENEIIEYKVSGDKLEVVDIPTGYTHSIVNIGEKDLVTVMWVNECFNPEKPDTYFLEV